MENRQEAGMARDAVGKSAIAEYGADETETSEQFASTSKSLQPREQPHTVLTHRKGRL